MEEVGGLGSCVSLGAQGVGGIGCLRRWGYFRDLRTDEVLRFRGLRIKEFRDWARGV